MYVGEFLSALPICTSVSLMCSLALYRLMLAGKS